MAFNLKITQSRMVNESCDGAHQEYRTVVYNSWIFPHNLFTIVEYFRKIIFDEPFEDLAPVVLRVWRVMVQIMMELRIVFKLLLPTEFFWESFIASSFIFEYSSNLKTIVR